MTDPVAVDRERLHGGRSFQESDAERTIVALDLAKYVGIGLKHRFLIAGSVIVALLIGLAVTLLTTPIYTASATLQIDRQAAQVLGEAGDIAPKRDRGPGGRVLSDPVWLAEKPLAC